MRNIETMLFALSVNIKLYDNLIIGKERGGSYWKNEWLSKHFSEDSMCSSVLSSRDFFIFCQVLFLFLCYPYFGTFPFQVISFWLFLYIVMSWGKVFFFLVNFGSFYVLCLWNITIPAFLVKIRNVHLWLYVKIEDWNVDKGGFFHLINLFWTYCSLNAHNIGFYCHVLKQSCFFNYCSIMIPHASSLNVSMVNEYEWLF